MGSGLLIVFRNSYGMTETCSGVICQRTDGGAPGKHIIGKVQRGTTIITCLPRIGSIGVICPNIECKIVDDKDNGKWKPSES